MAYFSNGTEAEIYRDKYCSRCAHDVNSNCAVWLAHLVAPREEMNNERSILHILIPQHSDMIGNKECRMYIPMTLEQ